MRFQFSHEYPLLAEEEEEEEEKDEGSFVRGNVNTSETIKGRRDPCDIAVSL